MAKVISVEPDSELDALAGTPVDWRYTAQLPRSTTSANALAWARASFDAAPRPLRTFLVVGWRSLLLDGRSRSDARHILGWPIDQPAPSTVVLHRRSGLGVHATLIFAVREHAVVFDSAMSYANRLGRIVWAVVAPIHRWAVRAVLAHAAQVIVEGSRPIRPPT